VTNVSSGSPADQAGIQAGDQSIGLGDLNAGGDLIVAIDTREVRTFDELLSYLITHKGPGDTVVLTVLRGDEKTDVTITLGKRP
jgi:S1-C subfamily serine protease